MKATKQTTLRASGIVFALAVAVSPVMAAAASDSENTVINANIGSTITVATATPVTLNLTPTASAVTSTASDTVTVNTNNTAGYTLTLTDSDAATTLAAGSDTIAAHAGTPATPTALADNTWGFAVANQAGFDASYSAENSNDSYTGTFAGVVASGGSAATLKTTAATATNDTTTVWYGAKVNNTQPTGAYTGTVTYTATTN